MSNLQTYYHFKLDFQKVDQHTGGKWLIHGTKRREDNQLHGLELEEFWDVVGHCIFFISIAIMVKWNMYQIMI